MEKELAIKFNGFVAPEDTKNAFAQWLFGNAKHDWNIPRVGALVYNGLLTKYDLHKFNKYAGAGNNPDAEESANDAYRHFDGIIKGVPVSELEEFAEEYLIPEENIDIIKKLNENGWKLHIVSGAIQEFADRVLKDNGIDGLFEGVYCNHLDTEDGIIRGLKKEVITPYDKILKLKEKKPELDILYDLTAVGCNLWDMELLKAANAAIVIDTAEKPAHPFIKDMVKGRTKEGQMTCTINNLYELPKALSHMDYLKQRQ